MSYTLAYTGTQIDNILGRSAPNGEFDGYFADINAKLDKLNIVTTSDDYATIQAYIQNNVAVALSDGGKFYTYAGEYDGNFYFARVTQGSSDTTDAVYEVAFIDSGNNWSVGGWSSLAPVFSPNFTGNPTAPTPIQSSNNTRIATTAFVHSAVDPVSQAALNAYPTDTVSGDVVTISDGADGIPVKSFVGSILPQQNLNGQSAPYPAGGGKNKFQTTASTTTNAGVTFTVNSDGSVKLARASSNVNNATLQLGTITLAAGSYIVNGGGDPSTQGYMTLRNGSTDAWIANITASDYALTVSAETTYKLVAVVPSNLSPTNTLYPMIRLATVSDATFAPYSNICPISGWSGAEIYHRGKNWLSSAWEEGSYNASGQKSSDSSSVRTVDMVAVIPSTSYTIGVTESRTVIYAQYYTADGSFISRASVGTSAFTTPSECAFLTVRMTKTADGTNPTGFILRLTSSSATYEPYKGQTRWINFGVNQWDEVWEQGALSTGGASVANANCIRSTNYIPVDPSTTYHLHIGKATQNRILYYSSSKTVISYTTSSNYSRDFTTPADCAYIRFCTLADTSPYYGGTYNGDIFIGDYFVYGGTLDVTTGVLTVDKATLTLDGASTYSDFGFNTYGRTISGVVMKTDGDIISSQYPAAMTNSWANMPDMTLWAYVYEQNSYVRVRNSSIASAANFKAALAANPIQVVYTLATPITYQLTPAQVTTLLGSNTVWTDVGSVTGMTYRADTALYIDKKLGA